MKITTKMTTMTSLMARSSSKMATRSKGKRFYSPWKKWLRLGAVAAAEAIAVVAFAAVP